MLPDARIILHRTQVVVEEDGGIDARMTDEVQELHVIHDVLDDVAAAVGEVDAEGLLEEIAVLVGEDDDDGGKRVWPKTTFLTMA